MKKIYCDLQNMKEKKTGLGFYTENLFKRLVQNKKNIYKGVIYGKYSQGAKQLKNIFGRNIVYRMLPYYSNIEIKNKIFWRIFPFKIDIFFRDKIDIYHCFHTAIPSKSSSKTIITVHDIIPILYPNLTSEKKENKKYLENLKEKCNRATIVITVSEYSKRDIIKYLEIDSKKIRVVSPGIELEDYGKITIEEINRIKEKYNLQKKFILFLGTLEPKKNIVNIIKGFERINIKNMELIIAGGKGWKYEEIFETYENSKYKNNIKMLDYIPEEDKIALYKAAELFIFPSLYEGFGMPVLEAMATGTPVITSNISSLPEVAEDAAILVNPYDIVEIAKAIENVIKNDRLKKEMIEKGLKQARKFTWENSVKKLEKIYSEL